MGKNKGRLSPQMKGARMIPIIPKEYKPFENMPVDERVAAIQKAKSLLGRTGRPTDVLMTLNFFKKINKKFAHNVKKSHKTERKVSR